MHRIPTRDRASEPHRLSLGFHYSRFLAFLCLSLAFAGCDSSELPKSKAGGDWGFIKFSEVRAYRTNWEEQSAIEFIVTEDGQLNRTRIPHDGIPLDASQVARLHSAIATAHPEPDVIAACFNPHHAFVFYDESGKIIAYVDLCFQCGNYRYHPDGFSRSIDWGALESLVKELGMPIANSKWE